VRSAPKDIGMDCSRRSEKTYLHSLALKQLVLSCTVSRKASSSQILTKQKMKTPMIHAALMKKKRFKVMMTFLWVLEEKIDQLTWHQNLSQRRNRRMLIIIKLLKRT